MATTTEMMQALEKVMDPELGRSIVELGMVKDLVQDETGKVSFTLALTIMGCPLKNHMANDAKRALGALPGVTGGRSSCRNSAATTWSSMGTPGRWQGTTVTAPRPTRACSTEQWGRSTANN